MAHYNDATEGSPTKRLSSHRRIVTPPPPLTAYFPTFPYNSLATLITRAAVTLTTSLSARSLGGVNNKQVGEARWREITVQNFARRYIPTIHVLFL